MTEKAAAHELAPRKDVVSFHAETLEADGTRDFFGIILEPLIDVDTWTSSAMPRAHSSIQEADVLLVDWPQRRQGARRESWYEAIYTTTAAHGVPARDTLVAAARAWACPRPEGDTRG